MKDSKGNIVVHPHLAMEILDERLIELTQRVADLEQREKVISKVKSKWDKREYGDVSGGKKGTE